MARRNSRRPTVPVGKPARRNALRAAGVEHVDYKDVQLLRTLLSERGKIRSRRITGLTPQQQKEVARAVKNAREMALLPYSSR